MSWDVVLFDAPVDLKSIAALPKDYEIEKFARIRAIDAIRQLFPENSAFGDKGWGRITGDGWSMEVNLSDEEMCSSLMLPIRGAGDPVTAALAIAEALKLTPIDCSSGDVLTLENNCFNQWRAYRDQVISQTSRPSMIERLSTWLRVRKSL